MMRNKMKANLFFLLVLILKTGVSIAQGDGPRTFLLAPKGLWGINSKATFLSQNFLPSSDILISDADIQVNVVPTTFFHTFSLGGRFAQAMVMVNPGSAIGKVVPDPPGVPSAEIEATGFADGFVGFKLGLIGAPAMSIADFVKHTPAFSMNGYIRWWYSGSYDTKSPLNLGTNRSTFEFGLPMSIPLGNNTKRATWIESYPSVRFYTPNNDPTVITQAELSQQRPLFLFENHLTHNLNPKFWVGVDLRYQYGGELKLDGEKQGNKINPLGAGVEAGYQIASFLSANGGYGGIILGENEARSSMLRVSLVFIYANMNK